VEELARWHLAVAGLAAGVSLAGFFVALFVRLAHRYYWPVRGYEPVAAFVAALGVWLCAPRRSRWEGLLGGAAALLGMLLGDLFKLMGETWREAWWTVPGRLAGLFHWGNWPKLLLYAFGLYLGWYLGSARRGGEEAGRQGEWE
jgi:hypothetical protein